MVSSTSKNIILACVATVLLSSLIAVVVFFVTVRGEEQILVPDLTGRDILDALVELQTKELYPRVQLRYTDTAEERGVILEQDPPLGSIVKAGRRVKLVVSRGVRLTAVDNYVGRSLNDVRADLAAESSVGRLVTLKEPFIYQTSSSEAGIILMQNPSAGTPITGAVAISLVISSGLDTSMREMPYVVGLGVQAAAKRLGDARVRFVFNPVAANAPPYFQAAAQDWPSGTQVPESNVVNIGVNVPSEWAESEKLGLYSFNVPRSPVPLPFKLTANFTDGLSEELGTEMLMGGLFTWPYLLEKGTVLTLTVQGREIHRETIG
jgi:beta-lactam-binding protein with PASTA domain